MIQITIIGHLGKDASISRFNSKSAINFSVAETKKYKDSTGAQVTKTTWFEVVLWRENTSIAQYLKKGQQICVVANSIESGHYKNNTGQIIDTIKVQAENIVLLGGNSNNTTSSYTPAQQNHTVDAQQPYSMPSNNFSNQEIPDDLPF